MLKFLKILALILLLCLIINIFLKLSGNKMIEGLHEMDIDGENWINWKYIRKHSGDLPKDKHKLSMAECHDYNQRLGNSAGEKNINVQSNSGIPSGCNNYTKDGKYYTYWNTKKNNGRCGVGQHDCVVKVKMKHITQKDLPASFVIKENGKIPPVRGKNKGEHRNVSESECRALARKNNMRISVSDVWTHIPYGCSVFNGGSNNHFYFNKNEVKNKDMGSGGHTYILKKQEIGGRITDSTHESMETHEIVKRTPSMPDTSVTFDECKAFAKRQGYEFANSSGNAEGRYKHDNEPASCFLWNNKSVYYNTNMSATGKCNYPYGNTKCIKKMLTKDVMYERKNVAGVYVLPTAKGKEITSMNDMIKKCKDYSFMCHGFFKNSKGIYKGFVKISDELLKSGIYDRVNLVDNVNGHEVYYRKFVTPEEKAAAENLTNEQMKNDGSGGKNGKGCCGKNIHVHFNKDMSISSRDENPANLIQNLINMFNKNFQAKTDVPIDENSNEPKPSNELQDHIQTHHGIQQHVNTHHQEQNNQQQNNQQQNNQQQNNRRLNNNDYNNYNNNNNTQQQQGNASASNKAISMLQQMFTQDNTYGSPIPRTRNNRFTNASSDFPKYATPKQVVKNITNNMMGNKHKYKFYTNRYRPKNPNCGVKPVNAIYRF